MRVETKIMLLFGFGCLCIGFSLGVEIEKALSGAPKVMSPAEIDQLWRNGYAWGYMDSGRRK